MSTAFPTTRLCLLSLISGLTLGSSAMAQNTQVLNTLNQFTRNNTQRETARAVAILCPAGGRLSNRLQQDCNALVGSAFSGESAVSTAISRLTADQTPLAANRAQLDDASATLNLRGSGFGGKIGGVGSSLRPASFVWQNLDANDGGAWSVFGSIEAGRVDRDASANQDGFDGDVLGLTIGLDRRLGSGAVVGAALRYRKSEEDFTDSSGELDQKDLAADAYFVLQSESPWYLNGLVSVGKRDSDQARNTVYNLSSSTVSQRFFAGFDTDLLSAALSLGYSAHSGSMSVDPYVQLEYARQEVDGYTEQASNPTASGAGWAVSVDPLTGRSTIANVGVNVQWAISRSNGVVSPFVGLRWSQVLSSQEDDVGLRFNGDVSAVRERFFASTDDEDEGFGTFVLGISAQFADGFGGFVRLNRNFAEDRFDRSGLQVGFRAEF